MCNRPSLCVWLLTLVCVATGLACIIAGAVGDSWWKKDGIEIGLWEFCDRRPTEEFCHNRMNILEFKKPDDVPKNTNNASTPMQVDLHILKSRELDAVLLTLIISSGFAFFALLANILMLCCHNKLEKWRCGALMTTLFAFIAAIAGFAAMIYAEVEFEEDWDKPNTDHGWSEIVAWIGACFLTIAFITSFIMICLSEGDFPESGISYSQNGKSGMAARGAANRGYEMK